MYTRSTPEEIIIGNETEEVAENLIMSILQKYKDNLQNKMKGSEKKIGINLKLIIKI